MTILDALETIDKSADKLDVFNALLADSLTCEDISINLQQPAMRSGLYHFIDDVVSDLRLASDAVDIPGSPVKTLAFEGVDLKKILDALRIGSDTLYRCGHDHYAAFLKSQFVLLSHYLEQQEGGAA